MKHFDGQQFHDCFLLSFDFSDWMEKVAVVLFCPNAGEEWEDGRYIKLTFWRVLFFGFEVSVIGEFGPEHPLVHDIVLDKESTEAQIWRERIEQLAKRSRNYPEGIESPNYSEVYHFIFDSVEFEVRAFFSGRDGFQIMCR